MDDEAVRRLAIGFTRFSRCTYRTRPDSVDVDEAATRQTERNGRRVLRRGRTVEAATTVAAKIFWWRRRGKASTFTGLARRFTAWRRQATGASRSGAAEESRSD